MAIISLRAYNREIEEMLDNGQNEEAITHCRYILKHYPKHVETYRLMGKALLEDQRLGDASDVFQRVLACIPDDFIAHLGMSIVREDEGDLGAALWHMERAFEIQPSNAAVQAELRRLYGRRDGLSPTKIQLTRGALARMSAKSNLNSQAINELRAALAEDPARPDLQVVLARLYALTSQNLAAIEISNALLKKLPYCLEANRILAESLPGTERAKDAEIYRKRYEELDPYGSQISAASPSTELVPDGAISLDRLAQSMSSEVLPESSQPGWAASLGVSFDQAEDVPEWLSEITNPLESSTSEVASKPGAHSDTPSNEAIIRDQEEGVSGDDVPDWLREINQDPIKSSKEDNFVSALPDWLQQSNIDSEEFIDEDRGNLGGDEKEKLTTSESPDIIDGEKAAALEDDLAEVLPSVLIESAVEAGISAAIISKLDEGGDMVQEEDFGDRFPEELEDKTETAASDEIEQPTLADKPVEPAPDWLDESDSGLESSGDDEVPEWLQDLGQGLPAEPIISEGQEPVGMSFVDEANQTLESPEQHSEDDIREGIPDSIPEWLAGASIDSEASTADSTTIESNKLTTEDGEEISRAEVPDWLRQMEEEYLTDVDKSHEEIPSSEALEMTHDEQHFTGGDIPSWLVNAMEADESSELSSVNFEAEPDMDQQILGDTQPIRATSEESEQTVEETFYRAGTSITELEIETKVDRESFVDEGEQLSEVELSAELPAMSDQDEAAALAWLESLAARQGALEEELLTQPGDRMEDIPEWVQHDAAEGMLETIDQTAAPGPGVHEDIQPIESYEELVDVPTESQKWSVETEAEVAPIVPTLEIQTEWIPEEGESVTSDVISEITPGSSEDLPAWLREVSQEEEIEQQPSWMAPEYDNVPEVPVDLITTKLDINAASLIQLERIPGVGFILAQNIINHRENKGPFVKLTELAQVSGFSDDSIPELENYLTVEVVTQSPPPPSTIPELQGAWEKISSGDISSAMEEYSGLIRQEQHLDDVIRDLQEAITLHPVDAVLYQTLGDAYVRANRLQDALNAYNRAEDLLK